MRKISVFRFVRVPALFIAVIACAKLANAITVRIDYTTDSTNKFFSTGNPQGDQAKAAMEAAAAYYSTILKDTFGEIDVPDKFYGSKGGEATWFWKRKFLHPETGFNDAEINAEIDENEYVVFVGARDLPEEGALGLAGPGVFAPGIVHRNGELTAAEEAEINSIQANFADAVNDRGETSGFVRWGGSIAFDSEADWHFNHTTSLPVDDTNTTDDDVYDFYSVALHELGHALGFGGSEQWDDLVSEKKFTGASVKSVLGNNEGAVLASENEEDFLDDDAHWFFDSDETDPETSPVYGASGVQVPLMVPVQANNVRSFLTDLDAAALVDIGWDIDLPASSASAASFVSLVSVNSSSGATNVAALSVSAVPEPGSAVLVLFAGSLLLGTRRRRVG